MINDMMILEYAEKGAQCEYEKAQTAYGLFRDDESKNRLNDAGGTWRQIRNLRLKEMEKAVAGHEVEPKPEQTAEAQQAEKSAAEEHAQKQTVTSGRIVSPDEVQQSQPKQTVDEVQQSQQAEPKRPMMPAGVLVGMKSLADIYKMMDKRNETDNEAKTDWSVNVEFASGRKMCFHHDDKDLARHMYEFTKEQAKGAFHGDILRASLVQHNTDKSETVLASMDIG